MKISITRDKLLKDIQSSFSEKYPYLKIEFYSQHHDDGQASPKQNLLNHNLTIEDVQKTNHEGQLDIVPDMKVKELEHLFETEFGLFIQLFRKSGNIWLQTIRTDHWTLAEQHEEAILMSTKLDQPERGDYHEQE